MFARLRRYLGGTATSGRIVAVGLVLIAAQLAYRAWALAGSWFYFDDLAFMSRAMNQPFDSSYLLESYGGHLMPAGFALNWLLTKWAVFEWAPWAVVLLAMQALAAVGMLRLLLSMFGRTPVVLVLLAGYLSWVFTLSAGIWWAAGINQLPMQIALVFGLHAHLDHLRTRRVRSLVWAVAWTLVGLAFYEKTLLLVGVYGLIAFAYFCAGDTPHRLRSLWHDYRTAVVAYSVLTVGYLAFYVAFGLDFSPAQGTSQSWSPIAFNLVAVSFSTAVVGGPLTWEPLTVGSFADPSQLVMLLSWVAVGSLLWYAHRTRTMSRRAWAPLAFTLVCNVALLASARAIIVGPDIAREYRYQTESAALAVLGLGLAFLPLVGATEINDVRPDVPRPHERRQVLTAATAAVTALAMVSTGRYVELWQDRNPTEAYVNEATRTLAAARHKPVPLVDLGVPQTLMWAFRYPENTFSHIFRNLAAQTSYPHVSVDRLFMFAEDGQLRPVSIPPTRRMLDAPGCGYPLAAGETRIPLDGPVIGGGWWVQLGYASPRTVDVRITAGDEHHRVALPRGVHNVYFSASGSFSEIIIRDDEKKRVSGLCVTDTTLGIPEPVSDPA